jgi:hypothetical protein
LEKNLEKSPPQSAGQFQSNLEQIILKWREFKLVQIKGQVLFKEEIITKIGCMGSFKNLLKNHVTRKTQIYMKVFWHCAGWSLFKLWSAGVEWVQNKEDHFTSVFIRRIGQNVSGERFGPLLICHLVLYMLSLYLFPCFSFPTYFSQLTSCCLYCTAMIKALTVC